jgi:hypothetical protein
MGTAAASYWLMGGSPSKRSMDRSIELVEYKVLSTIPCFTYGQMTSPTVRRAST